MPDEKDQVAPGGLFASFDKIIAESSQFRGKFSEGQFKLKKAPNNIVFIESKDFLAGPELFPEQYRIVRDFFELACPLCNDVQNIDSVPRESQILFEYNICPECGTHKEDIVESLNCHNTMIGVVGMRSGKSMCTAMICASYVHEILCIDNIQEKYQIAGAQTMDGAFAAAAGMQAAETVWGQFKGLYESSPWFQDYKRLLMDTEISDTARRRGDLYWETDSSIFWKHKKLRLRAVTSNSASQAGRTRFFSVIDELSRFDSGGSKRSATEVYRALDNSLLNFRKGADRARKRGELLPDGMMICISSPLFSEDKSMQLLKDALKDSKMYSFHKATWEFNPTIDKEDFASLYERDPVAVERDFGAKPPGAENPFIKDLNLVDICIDRKRKSVFDIKEDFFERILEKDGQQVIYKFLRVILTGIRLTPMKSYHLHCDPGETGDSFCMAVGHMEDNRCVVDGAIEAKPLSRQAKFGMAGRSVHFPSMVDIILSLTKKYKMTVSYDKWNSTDQIHRIIDSGVIAIGKNLTRDDHMNMYYAMQNGTISFPAPEKETIEPEIDRNVPCSNALYQLRRLEDNGVKIDHPVNGHNDMIQCYVGVHRALYNPDFVSKKGMIKKSSIYQDAPVMKRVRFSKIR